MSGFLALLDDVAAIAKLAAAQIDVLRPRTIGRRQVGRHRNRRCRRNPNTSPDFRPRAKSRSIAKTAGRIPNHQARHLVAGAPLAASFRARGHRTSSHSRWRLSLFRGRGEESGTPWWAGHEEKGPQQAQTIDAAHLEEKRAKGAIKTDFILSAEIMTIALSTIEVDDLWIRAVCLRSSRSFSQSSSTAWSRSS